MSPFQHGEVYVTDDGAETAWSWATTTITSWWRRAQQLDPGKIYASVIQKERRGDYWPHGPVIPHITNEIKTDSFGRRGVDVLLVEIGGTVAIESLPS